MQILAQHVQADVATVRKAVADGGGDDLTDIAASATRRSQQLRRLLKDEDQARPDLACPSRVRNQVEIKLRETEIKC